MGHNLLVQPVAQGAKMQNVSGEENNQTTLVRSSFKKRLNFTELPQMDSSITLGYKKASKTTHDFRARRKKTYVQKMFLELVYKFSDAQVQKLLYLDLYQEICNETKLELFISHSSPHLFHCPASPYFSHAQKLAKGKHATIKSRFFELIKKQDIVLQPKDPFQLACTLQDFWEQAARIIEQQKQMGSILYAKAEALINCAKTLPTAFYPFEEKKTLVHISSVKMSSKGSTGRLKTEEKLVINTCIEKALQFGYEYYGLNSSYIKTISFK